jgi:alpha-1,6-mannosyltransferase
MDPGTLALPYLIPSPQSPASRPTLKSHHGLARDYKRALVILTVIGVVFRSEIAVLLATQTIWLYLRRRLSLTEIAQCGFIGLSVGLGLTVPIDSLFWQKFPLWPELTGFIFNVMNRQSSNWGTSPIYYYFTSALPRLLLNPATLLCIPFAVAITPLRRSSLDVLIPNLAFVAIYSLQPHKEWRFIVYVIPPLTAIAALGANWIWTRRRKSAIYSLLTLVLIASTTASLMLSIGSVTISSLNYPGADALNHLHALANGSQPLIYVHMDAMTCMTGVTRFLQITEPKNASLAEGATIWVYDKTDDEETLLHPDFWTKFDYAIAECPERVIGPWELVHTVNGFGGVDILRPKDDMREPNYLVAASKSGKGGLPRARVEEFLGIVWSKFGCFARTWFTRGWWVEVKMVPKVHILKRANAGV